MNLNARITVKFLLQMGALLIVLWCLIGSAFGFYLYSTRTSAQTVGMNPVMLLDKMPAETTIHGNTIHVSSNVLAEVKQSGGWLQILDDNGQAIYNFHRPKNVPTKYAPGLLVYDKSFPEKFGYQLSTWYGTVDHQSLTWLYGLPLKTPIRGQSHQRYVYILLVFTGSLLATIVTGFLFGRRIGTPVLHMMNWLQNLANGSYSEPTDARGLPKSKNGVHGDLRRPYRMYREVLAALERLAVALQQSDMERKRLEKTREEWITGITHDLRTPLASVKGYADLFASPDYKWTESEIRQFGQVISDKAAYMDDLIEDLGLTFRLRNQALPLRRKPENVVEIIRNVVIDFVNQAQSEGQTVLF
ncbi:MAG: HAMP domain-containing histidine kinase, partial [Alicyclobacillus herbarius]|uniref:sensor histidine kinase n=1 Tax=Alicyclobacillus herbarius TaxID=122960 RepID=UPI0023571DF7